MSAQWLMEREWILFEMREKSKPDKMPEKKD
jgi:hypothetical protein